VSDKDANAPFLSTIDRAWLPLYEGGQ